jgi:hypothetical protein
VSQRQKFCISETWHHSFGNLATFFFFKIRLLLFALQIQIGGGAFVQTFTYFYPDGSTSTIPPPDTESFADYITAMNYQYWGVRDVAPIVDIFQAKCREFPQCKVPLENSYTCVNAFESTIASNYNKGFLALLILLITWKLFLEVSKWSIIIYSIWQKQIPWSYWLTDFIRPCVLGPLLYINHINWLDTVIMHHNEFPNYLVRFVLNSLFNQFPSTVASFYYYTYVQATGLSITGFLRYLALLCT